MSNSTDTTGCISHKPNSRFFIIFEDFRDVARAASGTEHEHKLAAFWRVLETKTNDRITAISDIAEECKKKDIPIPEEYLWIEMSYSDFVRRAQGVYKSSSFQIAAAESERLGFSKSRNLKRPVNPDEPDSPQEDYKEYLFFTDIMQTALNSGKLPTPIEINSPLLKSISERKEKKKQQRAIENNTPPIEINSNPLLETIAPPIEINSNKYSNKDITNNDEEYRERERTAPESDTPTLSPPDVGDSRAFSPEDEIDEAMIRDVIAQSSLSSEGEITEEFIQSTIDAFKHRVLVELRARPGLSEHPDDQLPGDTHSQQGETHAAVDNATLPDSGDTRSPADRNGATVREVVLGEIDHTHDGIEHPFTCYYEGQYYAACPLQETEANTPTPSPAQASPPQSEQVASGQASAYENHIQVRRQVGHDGITSVTFDDLLQEQGPRAQADHSAVTPCGTVVTPDVPPSGVTTSRGKGKKAQEPALKCDTKEIQRRIDEHRGYALEERVEIIRERQAVKTWCNLHTLEEYTLVMNGLKNDPYWGKPENYYRIGGLTLLKETARLLAAAATQYRPTLRIVSTTEPPTVSGRPRLEVPPEYLAMMMGARS